LESDELVEIIERYAKTHPPEPTFAFGNTNAIEWRNTAVEAFELKLGDANIFFDKADRKLKVRIDDEVHNLHD